ncbi:MAG: hypothetical protein PWP48_718 [Clostridiales bacterium]|nr:hypothetical protein [Clostridiales bacterium]
MMESDIKELQKHLTYKTELAWDAIGEQRDEVFQFCEGYKDFLSYSKTERRCASEIRRIAEQKGFVPIEQLKQDNAKLMPGMKVYYMQRNKTIALAVIGKQSLESGFNLIGSHIDSPRLDLKQKPLYEDEGLAFFDTHYYGGIKKYQWVITPLAIYGTIIKADGSKVEISVGDKDSDPVFCITDLLPHLAKSQMDKKMSEGITGEGLNVLVGSMPLDVSEEEKDNIKERVKLAVLQMLQQKYGITEEDFISAEIELVPAFNARDLGFDRSMIISYAQDDRVCAYTSLQALLSLNNPDKTCVALFADKEEIGSVGNTGMESVFLDRFVSELVALDGKYNELMVKRILLNTKALSADVSDGLDPNYAEVEDKRNAAYIGRGVAINKYTGSRGKYGASDAHAEFVGEVRKVFNDSNIVWQASELGKVDEGGGGTIAMFLARYGMDVLDCGVPLLSMHAPLEVSSKADVYMTYKAYKAFYEKVK